MLKLILLEVFGGGSVLTAIAYWYSKRVRKQKQDALISASFIGGPLDGVTKDIYPVAVYQHKGRHQPGVAVYNNKGDGLYAFDEYVEDAV